VRLSSYGPNSRRSLRLRTTRREQPTRKSAAFYKPAERSKQTIYPSSHALNRPLTLAPTAHSGKKYLLTPSSSFFILQHMTQNTYSVSPKPSACLRPGARKTNPARGLSLAEIGGTRRKRPHPSGSSCILPSAIYIPEAPRLRPGDTLESATIRMQHPPFQAAHSATSTSPIVSFCPFRPLPRAWLFTYPWIAKRCS
jgi:hypothetical protein